eukprot:Phypoly_transcript_04934.p1 GENE.Phypoly_transcript_04934~~Phypoly_transcript_04934.p1  ORF type:complete len:590 (+),score=77.65 Phypoly_transcript_04934:98-1867(+)
MASLDRAELKQQFQKYDKNNDQKIDWQELLQAFNAVEEKKITGAEARDIIATFDKNKDGTIGFEEFVEALIQHKQAHGSSDFMSAAKKSKDATVNKIAGYSTTAGDVQHSYSDEEKIAFVDWINECLSGDNDLKSKLPISASGENLFKACHDGILLCKLINYSVPETIDERVLNKTNLSHFKVMENQVLCINSAKSVGCNVVNIGPHDLVEGRPYLLMGLIWQIIKIGLFSRVNLTSHPELYRLLESGEEISDLLKLPTDQVLLRWVNYHLQQANHPRRIHNFGNDIKDSEAYSILLKQIAPKGSGIDLRAMNEPNLEKRANIVLTNAEKLKCKVFLKPKDIVAGNTKLNMAFIANLFNAHSGLEVVENLEILEESREEKSFRNWMNSLGVDPYVHSFYDDLRDGLVLIQLFDKIYPGLVDHKKVNYPPFKAQGSEMKKIENCNYAVQLAKAVKFSVVGIDGKNIYDKNKNLTLSVVWQLMRAYTLSILQQLSGSDKAISDSDILNWANNKLVVGKGYQLEQGFKDSRLRSAVPIIDLCDLLSPKSVDYALVFQDQDEESYLQNAKLAISLSRRIGAVVFALPEDTVLR